MHKVVENEALMRYAIHLLPTTQFIKDDTAFVHFQELYETRAGIMKVTSDVLKGYLHS